MLDVPSYMRTMVLDAYRANYNPLAVDADFKIRSIPAPTVFQIAYEIKPIDPQRQVLIHAYFIFSHREAITHHFLGNLLGRESGDLKDEVFVFHGYLDRRMMVDWVIPADEDNGGGGTDPEPPVPVLYPWPYYDRDPLVQELWTGVLAGGDDEYFYYSNPNSGAGDAELHRIRAKVGLRGENDSPYNGVHPDLVGPDLWWTPSYPQGVRYPGTEPARAGKVLTFDTDDSRWESSINSIKVRTGNPVGLAFWSSADNRIQRWLETSPYDWAELAIPEEPVRPNNLLRLGYGYNHPAFAVIARPTVGPEGYTTDSLHVVFPYRDGKDEEYPNRVVLGHAQLTWTSYELDGNGKRIPTENGSRQGYVAFDTQPLYEGSDTRSPYVLWNGLGADRHALMDLQIWTVPGSLYRYRLYMKKVYESVDGPQYDNVVAMVSELSFSRAEDASAWQTNEASNRYEGRVTIHESSAGPFNPYPESYMSTPTDRYPRPVSPVIWFMSSDYSAAQLEHIARHWTPVYDSFNCQFNWRDEDGTPVMIHRARPHSDELMVSKINEEALDMAKSLAWEHGLNYTQSGINYFNQYDDVTDWYQFMPNILMKSSPTAQMRRGVLFNSARQVLVLVGHEPKHDLAIPDVERVVWVGQSTLAYQRINGDVKFISIRVDGVPPSIDPGETPQA